ncbi:MAG TPA: hypothetical protein VGR28_05745 [Candidatus Thermoplasmatota archaeon]|jgi:hypothetical protein|nr:hypothetical protein [Candidatus Thermoplasmatota archaeon]
MKLKIALAAALMVLPVAAAAEPFAATPVVEGHTVFVRLAPEGSDLAAIAGSVECQVKWFDDQILFRVPAGTTGMCGDARFIYAYPGNAPDPRGNPTLERTDRMWDFTDPNGMPWHVVEYAYMQLQVAVNQNLMLPDFLGENITLEQFNYTAWVVEAGPSMHEPSINEDYNFVLLVDTSKVLLTQPDGVAHDGTPGGRENGNSHDNTRVGGYTAAHTHDKSWVTLGLGDTPPDWS